MRPIKTSFRCFILCFVLLSLLQTSLKSQSLNKELRTQYRWFVGVSGGASRTDISNKGTSVISGMYSTRQNSYCLSVEAGYFFSKYFGLSTGIGMSPYFTRLYLDPYANILDTVDSEVESYERRISGRNISEKQKIYFLEIPVMLNFRYPFSKAAGFYVQSGINLAIPFRKNYSSQGTFTYTGYYPAYNVLLYDIPYEGFKSNVKNDVSGELKMKSINPAFVASGGFYFCTEKQYQISVGFFYKQMLSDISDYAPVTSFQLSTHENQLRSLMEGSEKVNATSLGVLVSLRYYLK